MVVQAPSAFASVERASSDARTLPRVSGQSRSVQFAGTDSTGSFEILLSTALGGLGQQTSINSNGTASQMFDAPMADAGHHRQSMMNDQYRDDVSSAAAQRRDGAYGVEARAVSDGLANRSSGVPSGTGSRGHGVQSIADVGDKGATASRGATAARPDARPFDESPAMRSEFTDSRNSVKSAGAAGREASWTPAGTSHVTTNASGPALAKGFEPANGTPHSRAADQIGKLLSGDRNSNADSTRPNATLAVREGGRAPHSDGRPSFRSAERSPNGSGEHARKGEGSTAAKQSDFDSLVKSIRVMQSGTRMTSARLQLDPPSLGRMVVAIEMKGNTLHLQVRTETPAARDLLEDRVGQLRDALEPFGIHIEEFDIIAERRGADSQSFSFADRRGQTAGGESGGSHQADDGSRDIEREEVPSELPRRGTHDRDAAVGALRLDVRI